MCPDDTLDTTQTKEIDRQPEQTKKHLLRTALTDKRYVQQVTNALYYETNDIDRH